MAARPPSYAPQLATLVAHAPEGDDWLHEVKYDGFRMGLVIDGPTRRLLSRNGNDWTMRFPAIVQAARNLPVSSAVFDGEVALLQADGRTSFQALQGAATAAAAGGTLVYFLFDALFIDGEDLSPLPLEARKARLEAVLPRRSTLLRYSRHTIGDGVRAHRDACRSRLEGIISKRRDAPATAGRSRTWVKVKCLGRQEFVIGGYTDPQGAREGLGALFIGYYDEGRLVWAGKVGTGFTVQAARHLRARLQPLVQDESPFTPAPRGAQAKGAHWVRPTLVGEVAFTEWTTGGKVRHPSFQGLRDDKPARAVVREQAAAPAGAAGRVRKRTPTRGARA